MSEHFTTAELTFSQTAVRKGIDNTPTPEVLHNLGLLAALLEQVRALVGKPVNVSSGYRCPLLNTIEGGAHDSAHMLGLAADINVNGLSPKALALLIRESDIEYDQLIYEGTWVHVGLAHAGLPRRQELTAHFVGGRATYTLGIA